MILALDTSTSRGSIAVLDGDRLVLDEAFPCDRSQGSELYALIVRAQELAGGAFTRIAIGIGPGSYAGVRISIATALGLSLASQAGMVGLASVSALETDATEYIAIGDARRDAFYFTHVRDGVCVEPPCLLDAAQLAGRLADAPTLPVFTTAPIPAFPQAATTHPSAARLARLAAAEKGILARDDMEPLYLREPIITQPKQR